MARFTDILDRLPGGALVKRAALLGSGAAVGQAAVIGATPLLARIYGPADFGVLAVFLAVSGVSVVVSALRYEQAILVAESDEEASAVVKASAWCVLLSVTLASIAALAGGDALARFTSTPAIADLLWLLPVTVAAGGIHQIMVAWATRAGNFSVLSRSKAVLGISLAASQLFLGVIVDGAHGLVVGVAASLILTIIVLIPAMKGLSLARDHDAWHAAVRYRQFPQFGLWASLLNRGALEIPSVALAALYGPEVAGAFLLAVRVVATPTRLITESAYQVYVNEASRLQREEPSAMYTLFVRTLGRLVRLAVPLAVLLAVAGPWGFGIVFGPDWAEASAQVRLLAPLLVAMLITQPVAGTLWITVRLDLQLMREVVRVTLVIGAFLLAWQFALDSHAAVGAYVLAMVSGYGLLLILCRNVLRDPNRLATTAALAPA